MRLIDADKLPRHGNRGGLVRWKDIEEAPTIEERKTGRWIMHIDDLFPGDSTMECDQCHEHQPVNIDDNFCPNCGADMRGEQE